MNEKKSAKIKKWMKEHSEEVVVYGALAASFVGTVAICVFAAKAAKVEEEKWEATVNDALRTNKLIIPQKDGSFVIVDRSLV